MSLRDLKRKNPKQPKKSVSVDEFIEDANNYASGKPTLIGDKKVSSASASTHKEISKKINKKNSRLYRHATFSLTEKTISELDELSKSSGIAKSKLIRMLVDDFFQLDETSQKKRLE